MSTVTEHYERLLSKHYTWMFGSSFDERVNEQRTLLTQALELLKNRPEHALAIDLGCGPGFQAIALAQLGFSPVIAIDTSTELLEQARSHAANLPIQTQKEDLRNLPALVPAGKATVIVCMGDTLPHLPAKSDVGRLFHSVFDSLHPGGIFVITYRDLTSELYGTDRFIPVRSDDHTIMTCFLEFESPESVVVYDLVHTRDQEKWSLNKSSYRKLRLGTAWLCQELEHAGFSVRPPSPGGRLTTVIAVKPRLKSEAGS
jgi:SAM-dependent methyltransferase